MKHRDLAPRFTWAIFTVLPILGFACNPGPVPRHEADVSRVEQVGELTVIHLSGSYEEMGRQEVQLLGPVLRNVYQLQLDESRRSLQGGVKGWLLKDVLLPLSAWLGPIYETSGLYDELRGIADGLGVTESDVVRAIIALRSGSTGFAATGTATMDGSSMIARNVDFEDRNGTRRPLLIAYRPTNGDLDYIVAGWPLLPIPVVGMNETGFAISFNFFPTEPSVSFLLPQWPQRLALQRASTVAEGVDIFRSVRTRGISSLILMADASGDIAALECVPSACEVNTIDRDWFVVANHSQTDAMRTFDRYRSPDSFARLEAMTRAVEMHLGRLNVSKAIQVLRDRSDGPYPNESHVANLSVINSVVLHPASRTIWHSTSMQPYAPFGQFQAFSFDSFLRGAPPVPAAQWLESKEGRQERRVVAEARDAVRFMDEGRIDMACEAWDRIAIKAALNPARIAWEIARCRWRRGRIEQAYGILEETLREGVALDVRVYGSLAKAILADELGRRPEALRLYALVRRVIDAHPEFNSFDRLRDLARAGVDSLLTIDRLSDGDYYSRVPR